MTRLRRIALGLMAHAVRVFPYARSAWAEAMGQELDHIERDGRALRWAFGCVFAAYRERIRTMTWMQTRLARALLALPVLFLAIDQFFAPLLTLAYRLDATGLAAFLGARTPGDDYHRFIPLMNATPLGLQLLWVGSGLCFLAALVALLWGRRIAFRLFVAALALELIAALASQLLRYFVPAYHDAALAASTFTAPNFRRDVLVPAGQVILLALVTLLVWLSVGRARKT